MTEGMSGETGRGGQGQPSAHYTGRASAPGLAEQLGDMARVPQQEDSLQDTLDAIAVSAVQTVPGAEHAGLMVVRRRREIWTQAATGDVVQNVDRA